MVLPNDVIPVTQSWNNSILSPLGIIDFIEDKQYEFYNGSYSGSTLIVTTQNLFNNPFLKIVNPVTTDIPEEPWDNTLISKFENSDFDSLVNNVIPSRESTFNLDADYDKNIYIPDNITNILNQTAPKTATPDSYYTSHNHILPRYLGSRLFSADYNFYTPSGSIHPGFGVIPEGVLPYFLNGDTGSWEGDVSYGKTSAIDSYPRYFAHFKYAKENKEFWDTATYKIDALIECPQEDLKGTVAEPKVLKIEDDNQRLYEVANTFNENRKVKIDFKTENYKGIDYQTLEIAPQKIMQGGSKFKLVCGNELNKTEYEMNCSFNNSTWAALHDQSINGIINLTQFFGIVGSGTNTIPFTPLENVNLDPKTYGVDYFLLANNNSFTLGGGENGIISPVAVNDIDQCLVWGPGLGLIHTYNKSLKDQIIIDPDPGNFRIGIPNNLPLYSPLLNNKDLDNYFTFKTTSSLTDLSSYESYKIPFLVERGDQIRITWKDESLPMPVYSSQDFVVTNITTGESTKYQAITNFDVENSSNTCTGILIIQDYELQEIEDRYTNSNNPDYGPFCDASLGEGWQFSHNEVNIICRDTDNPEDCIIDNAPNNPPGQGRILLQIQTIYTLQILSFNDENKITVPGNLIYDTLEVFPNPLDFNIPNNKIKAFTIRRRVDSDNSVVIFQIPPKNSDGFNTLSGQGFLIPNDFSQTQKDNVLTLINALEAKNAFKPDE
jgi:hypothetical protein